MSTHYAVMIIGTGPGGGTLAYKLARRARFDTGLKTPYSLCCHCTWEDRMTTNLIIDDVLLERARRIGKLGTKKKTVTQALTEFIQRRRHLETLKAIGTIEFLKGWDYKKDRRDRESGR